MTSNVGRAYDEMADAYVAVAAHDLKSGPTRRRLDEFAGMVAESSRPTLDLGCGPGHITAHLHRGGLDVCGIDASRSLLAEARRTHPHLSFEHGDLAHVDGADGSLGGLVSRHSIIHADPAVLGDIFAEWRRVLARRGALFLSFFAAMSSERHGTPFDHAVVTAYELYPPTISEELHRNGFVEVDVVLRRPQAGERPLDHALLLARAG